MKYILSLLIIFSCSHAASAQKIRFTDTSNTWTEYWGWFSAPGNIVSRISENVVKGKIIIDSLEYSNTSFGFVREDTVQHKVYYHTTQGDQCLYDYNLKPGDSVFVSAVLGNYVHIVSDIDSVLINAEKYKIWRFTPLSGHNAQPYTIIEGIGCLNEPTFPMDPHYLDASTSLICFHNKGQLVTVPNPSGNYDYLSPASCALSVEKKVIKNQTLKISPNPANENSVFIFPDRIQSGKLSITNALGQTMISNDIVEQSEILLGRLQTSGFYYYKITDNKTGQVFTGKFLYQ